MSLLRYGPAWLLGLVVACQAVPCRADAPPEPLRLVPARADFVLKVERPRQLVQTILEQGPVKRIQEFEVFREFYDSTNARRFYQLLAHFEKKLGAGRFDLLDRIAGGGIVLSAAYAPEPTTLLVVQGKDEKLVHEFAKLGLEVVEQELARQESKDRIEKSTYRGIEGVHIGKQVYLAAVGSALLLANKDSALKAAIDLHLDGPGKSIVQTGRLVEARKLLPPAPLAWTWLNLEPVRAQPQAKVFFETFEAQPFFAPIVGGLLDLAKRSPFVCAGIYHKDNSFLTTVRFPRGRQGMSPAAALAIPPTDEDLPPLLEPKNVSFSASYYLDLGRIWENRDKLLTKQQLKGLDDFEKNSGRFLGGVKLGKLLSQAGSHQRFVSVQPGKSTVYKKEPKQQVGSFGLVQEMRDLAFARSMETIIRTGALFASTQFNLKLVEEKRGDATIVSYRFPENGKLQGDVNDVRFAFSPCFVQVGNQMVFSSTVELARELVDLLKQESGSKSGSAGSLRGMAYSAGLAANLRDNQEQFITQAVLGQALSPAAAREQVRGLVDLVERLGTFQIESIYGSNDYRLDLRLQLNK